MILTDSLGLLMGVKVLPANTSDADAARDLLEEVGSGLLACGVAVGGSGLQGRLFGAWVQGALHREVQITGGVGKPGQEGYRVAPRRWVVERTYAWPGRYWRLARQYEKLAATSANSPSGAVL